MDFDIDMKKEEERLPEINLKRPDEIKAYLDQFVIGQDEAKKVLSVAIYNHYKRIIYNKKNIRSKKNDVTIDKSNILMCGPTGSGKTFMIKTIAKLLNVACYIQDSSKVTASGYVGSDVEECIVGLLRSCDYDMKKAENGIIVLDEVDKIAKKDAGPSITRDVSGECVQQSLLKMVEGDVVGVPPAGGRKHPEQKLLYVDTTNILFIGIGAFVGLEDIVMRRLGSSKIGFKREKKEANKEENPLDSVEPQDMREFGFIPEFIGRFPIITHSVKLEIDDLAKILKDPKNSLIKQYTELLLMDGVKLSFNDDAIQEIAERAYDLGTGARGLRSIMEKIMTDIMYEAPKKHDEGTEEIIITKDIVKEKYSNKAA